ncbi:LTA synthase family protein [Pedobacter gandavensis]|uniref:LTA synthase family protein n=1 Tax=Pedobacter gandavensis TaxID=2679963 RepID=UPI002478EB3D|nr:LTA synthase family protein [Pedobacter gandavensis]WGQ10787.1 LTA synthase family protein [Pedobacter gandavensis]
MILIAVFSFFAEFTFWGEFESRFNFIAVDYLIYTYEVINNINESYPLPYLIVGVVAITVTILLIIIRSGSFSDSFRSNTRFRFRITHSVSMWLVIAIYAMAIDNSWAEKSENRYQNELSKAGVYSFFSAFKNNELNYQQFYSLLSDEQAFAITRDLLKTSGSSFIGSTQSIRKKVTATPGLQNSPNVIMIVLESFSADFMGKFGNEQSITPVLDSLADQSLFFTNMYATGTRTVRGMEALSLAVPPTPGNSIVRRKNNKQLSTIGSIFANKGYKTTFFYGGDGYFDNMNQYFGNNGFNIVDRGRKLAIGDDYKTDRKRIANSEVNFENAWGISDEDLYGAVIKDADAKFSAKQSFYNFVMTTSNHRPFTYPKGKIDIPSGLNRDGAVKYTDYAIGQFLKKARTKPWFSNTVFIIISDHCASSAGKNEIDVDKYHIPAMIYNLPGASPSRVEKVCSQIDLYPTLFSVLNWSYTNNNYGLNVLDSNYTPRALIATYQKLGYMRNDSLVILSPRRKVESFYYNRSSNEQYPQKVSDQLIKEAISSYQTAYHLYSKGGLKK